MQASRLLKFGAIVFYFFSTSCEKTPQNENAENCKIQSYVINDYNGNLYQKGNFYYEDDFYEVFLLDANRNWHQILITKPSQNKAIFNHIFRNSTAFIDEVTYKNEKLIEINRKFISENDTLINTNRFEFKYDSLKIKTISNFINSKSNSFSIFKTYEVKYENENIVRVDIYDNYNQFIEYLLLDYDTYKNPLYKNYFPEDVSPNFYLKIDHILSYFNKNNLKNYTHYSKTGNILAKVNNNLSYDPQNNLLHITFKGEGDLFDLNHKVEFKYNCN